MKTTYTKKSILFLAIVLGSLTIYGQEKTISKSLTCKPGSVFSIENKYGNIDIRDWEKHEIEVQATVILKNVPADRAERILEFVDINIREHGDTITAETHFDDAFFESIGNIKTGSENKFEVNYTVMMPSDIRLKAYNKYGSIFINKLTSASEINLQYGVLKINQLEARDKQNMARINLSYSKATIESCEWVKLQSKYSKITIENSKALILLTKYSKLYIDEGSTIISDSKYDEYEIGSIENLVVEASYSDYKIETVSNKISLESNFTDVRIDRVPASFNQISLVNQYGSIHLGIASGASYRLSGEASYATIHYPESVDVKRTQDADKLSVEGIIGNDKSTKSAVKIQSKYGGINLMQ
ncbi:MAG: hypothetical protein JW801_02805 [Bacteroidales bacterium]|nr:hypothetical protein [Bacteroidales bacterium]